jgi:hypothetical protein
MRFTRPLATLAAMLVASALLVACGGSDDDPADTSVATQEQSATTAPGAEDGGGSGEQAGGGSSGSDGGGATGSSRDGAGQPSGKDRPASLETDPASIRRARVTATGAVQTLPPSTAAQEKAIKNSYPSIKAFGEESEGEEATDITFALVQYLDAKANGDWATACSRIYSVLRANLEKEGRSCAETYGQLISRSSASARAEAAKIDVASVRRGEDNRAFVIYKTPDTLSADMPMYLDGGVWTVGALEAYVLTPDQLNP